MRKQEEAEVIRVYGDSGNFLWLTEEAANRLSWILAAAAVLIISPLIILSFLV